MAQAQGTQGQGTIVQSIGAVIDIEFPREHMPNIYDALILEDTPENGAVWTVVSSGPWRGGFRGAGEDYPEMHSVTLHCTSEHGETVVSEVSREWEGLSEEELLRRIEAERAGEPQEDDEP